MPREKTPTGAAGLLDENRKILMVSSKWRAKERGWMRSEAPQPVQRQMEGFSEVPQRGP